MGEERIMAEVGTLHDAFINELCDTYDAEQQLTKALSTFADAARSADLRAAFEEHLDETRGHLERLEAILESMDEAVRGKHCEGMAGILEEGKANLGESFDEATMDALLIAAGQRAEHYEIAAYNTLIAWARAMGHTGAADLLRETLREERSSEERLSAIGEGGINQEAAHGVNAPEDPEDEDANDTDEEADGVTSASSKKAALR
jgi:ferritin-like metal-binding protein YciE